MKKILLVEDDNNLREIYGARLLAEGYDIVSAKDGEEALSMAVAEKPDLIISDIMMPKISGFDMLDILRATPQTKETKVIMMTALSQAEDRERGERLGADRYLVKSQVTLEDVVKVVSEVLGSLAAPEAAGTPAAVPAATPVAPAAVPEPVAPAPAATPVAPADPAPAPDQPAAAPAVTPVAAPPATPAPAAPAVAMTPPVPPVSTTPPVPPTPAAPAPAAPAPTPEPESTPDSSTEPAGRKPKVIAPISSPETAGPDLNKLLADEIAKEQGATVTPTPAAPAPAAPPAAPVDNSAEEAAVQDMLSAAKPASSDDEKKQVSEQIQDFVGSDKPDDQANAAS